MAIETKDSLTVRAARVLLHRGDDGGQPINRNGVGFNKPDYGVVRRYVTEIDRDGMTVTQEWALSRILVKYRRQLGEIGVDIDDLDAVTEERWRELGGLAVKRAPVVHAWQRDVEAIVQGDAAAPPALSMADVLGLGGIIAQRLADYESRPQQVDFSQAVADAITAKTAICAEAGTGVGKSLGYLIPAIYAGMKTIVSTEGKALQDQLAKKDLPFLAATLPSPFSFALLKGLSNYACLAKVDEEIGEQKRRGESHEFAQFRTWLKETASGDLAELSFTVNPEMRDAVTSSSDECLGKHCAYFDRCWGMKARQAAKKADVVVVNHTLLTLDLALRAKTDDGVSVLPDRQLIVIDEAHAFPEIAIDAFTVEVNNWSVSRLLRGKLPALAELADDAMTAAREASSLFFAAWDRDKRLTFVVPSTEGLAIRAMRVQEALSICVTQAKETAADLITPDKERVEKYAERLANLADAFGEVLSAGDGHVLYIERTVSRKQFETTTLKRAPIAVGDYLRNALWSKWPVVATSATLSTGRTFDYFREQSGCDDGAEISVDSPFDFPRNALLYLPPQASLFDPTLYYQEGSVEYFDRLGNEIEQLLLASDGRAFCLFTSRRALDEVYQRIRPRLRWEVLRQGDYGTQEMVRRFKSDGHAVLFGLRSFMTGVDVQGEALSMVVIDKLNFTPPDDPVFEAWKAAITEESGDKWAWFQKLAIPTATILLKQAVGRLIRTKTDRGVVALLDGRLVSKRYGAGILRSLPPMSQTRSLDDVRAFFR